MKQAPRRGAIAISCGDPAGIGPEVAARAWRARHKQYPMIYLGSTQHLPEWVPTRVFRPEVPPPRDSLAVVEIPFAARVNPGRPDPANAPGIIRAIDAGIDLVTRGLASALCTMPVSKQVVRRGLSPTFTGHTEYLAERVGAEHAVMMLVGKQLRVVPVTVHLPLTEVATHLTQSLLERTLRITWRELRWQFGIREPRIAVSGLNPHAGEGGTLGKEEARIIIPVLERLRCEGLMLTGPHSADVMFHPAARSTCDVAVCMYHDQALIPLKTIDFACGVNVTLGLPFVRTSPDHGTAFDIAGKDVASASSAVAALDLAWALAGRTGHNALNATNGDITPDATAGAHHTGRA